jgi:hypothetical protein
MRIAAAGAAILALVTTSARAEPLVIDQSAWMNYTVIANATKNGSSLKIQQRGEINAISSVQLSGPNDAEIHTHQRGRRNAAVIHQDGWIASSVVVQEGPHGPGGYTNLPMQLTRVQTDEGYLTYFTTGGFSLVSLTDPQHTWFSRFGRSR